MEEKIPRRISYHAQLDYKYSAGKEGTYFFEKLKDNKKFMATHCPKCGKNYIPPRPVCGDCFEQMDEWVEVGPRGTLEAWTVVYMPFMDPQTGKKREVPYGYGFIRLDGTENRLQHYLEESDQSKLRCGLRVEPVFKEKRVGTLADIEFFRIVQE